jgi:MFS family permease
MIPISLIPLIYVVTNDIRWIYIYTIVGQMSWAGFDSATFAYFSDVLPKENRSSMVSAYNLLTGMSQAVAPFVGGLLVDSLNNISFVFIASFLLRIFSMNLFEKLEERVGTKGGGYGFIPWGISYRIEMFFNTYSMAIDGVRKEGKKVIDIGRVRKIISKYRT